MSETWRLWAYNLGFATLVALSFVCYGQTFRRLGAPDFSSPHQFFKDAFKVFLDPYFIAGLGLALLGSLVRMVLMQKVGIARTALVSELTLVLMLALSFAFFGSTLRFPRDYVGAALIVLGSYVVSS